MIKRILIALAILPALTVLIIMENPYPFAAVGVVALTIALFELFSMLRVKGIKTFSTAGMLFALVIYGFVVMRSPWEYYFYAFAGFIIILFMLVIISKNSDNLPAVFFTTGAVMYIAVLGSMGINLKFLDDGNWWMFILLLLTWVYDGGAYFVGSAMGKNKLIPEISPGKTVEGCAGGVIINVIVAVVVYYTVIPAHLGLQVYDMAILAVLLSVAGQAGDLSASVIKRYCDVKNSSGLLGPMGGLMDKVDSAIFNAPLLYIYIEMVL